ncbi:hypothetical protein R1T08_10125 [Streptomyces sp. SBC-4]|nr:hypothetical protein [Streptomyces sp. SBC-4]MDV5144577.1 hypothetical protein [Streptomyces sp. SBC-4]
MRWPFRRGKTARPATQSAAGATTQGPITLIQGVQGDVTVVAAHQPAPPGAPEIETARAQYATRVRQRYGRLDLEVLTPLRNRANTPSSTSATSSSPRPYGPTRRPSNCPRNSCAA